MDVRRLGEDEAQGEEMNVGTVGRSSSLSSVRRRRPFPSSSISTTWHNTSHPTVHFLIPTSLHSQVPTWRVRKKSHYNAFYLLPPTFYPPPFLPPFYPYFHVLPQRTSSHPSLSNIPRRRIRY